MERALLMIVSLVFIVGLVGMLTVLPTLESGKRLASNDLAGNVVAGVDRCSSCSGTPVCAAKNGKVSNYDNACAASCADARVIFDAVCERIPSATK